jgi:ABC-type sugar transport system permease subunit
LDGLGEAVRIIQSGDFDVWEITIRSMMVSGFATGISLFFGILVGSVIAFNQFPGRNLAFSLVNTGMGLPPVVVGLMVAIMLWRSGPLGEFASSAPTAVIIAQTVIAPPSSPASRRRPAQSPPGWSQLYGWAPPPLHCGWCSGRPLLAAVMAVRGRHLRDQGVPDGGGNLAGTRG